MSGATRRGVERASGRACRAGTRRPCPCPRNSVLIRSPASSIDRAASSDGRRARLLRPIRQRRRIERQDLGSAPALLALVESLARFLADPAALDRAHVRHEARGSSTAVRFLRDVREHVDAGDVHRAERGALRPAERRAGDRVDLLDRVSAGLERAQHLRRRRTAPMWLAMKFGVSFATTTPLPRR